tara:strand:+ start:292 stop:843 length:552 start_codon:yes stop_codon:yes gene_type:complete
VAKIKRNKSPKSSISKNKFQLSSKILNGGIALMTIFLVGFIFSFSTKIIQNGNIDKVQFPAMSISESAEEIYESNPLLNIDIEILNGCGEPGLAAKFSDLLRKQRIDVVRSENANHFDYENTILIQRTENVEGMKIVAKALNLDINNKNQVITLVDSDLDVDLTLIVGKDYRNIPAIRRYISN